MRIRLILILTLVMGAVASPPARAQWVDPGAGLRQLRPVTERPQEPPPCDALAESLPSQKPVLDLQAALAEAYSKSPRLKMAAAEVRKAYWRSRAAISQPPGTLTVGTVTGKGSAVLNSYSGLDHDVYVSASQNFLNAGLLGAARERARDDYNRSVADQLSTQMDLCQQVKDAFFELLASQELQMTVKKNLEIAEQLYGFTEARFQSGASPRLDVVNAGIERSRARQAIIDARARLKTAQANLNALLARPARQPLQAEGAYFTLPVLNLTYAQLRDLAKDSAKLQSARLSVEYSKHDVTYTARQVNPYISLQAVYDMTSPSYMVGAQLNLPLDWGQTRSSLREKEEEVLRLQNALEDRGLTLSASLDSSYNRYLLCSENASYFLKEILFPSEEALNITRFGYSRGALPFLQVLTAEQRLMQARTDYLDVLLKVRNSFHAVENAAGIDLEMAAPAK